MDTGSFASAGIDSRRQRALPVPRANADMKTFTPDSSIASDVIPSPNFGDRNNGRLADMILLHYTGMPDVEGAIAQLCTPGTDVSAHYIVLEDGRIVQCVPEAKRAWHAGVSFCAGAQTGSRRKISVAFAGQFRRRPLGAAGANLARRNAQARQHQHRRRGAADGARQIRLQYPDPRQV